MRKIFKTCCRCQTRGNFFFWTFLTFKVTTCLPFPQITSPWVNVKVESTGVLELYLYWDLSVNLYFQSVWGCCQTENSTFPDRLYSAAQKYKGLNRICKVVFALHNVDIKTVTRPGLGHVWYCKFLAKVRGTKKNWLKGNFTFHYTHEETSSVSCFLKK